jgi:hypothetical protein
MDRPARLWSLTVGLRLALGLAISLAAISSHASADDRDERAAATLGKLGAQIRRNSAGSITSLALFPDVSKVTDEDFACIDGLNSLKSILLIETRLTDAALAHLATLPALETLYLGGTYTDAQNVTRLGGIRFTSAGLAHLEKIKTLRLLVLASPGFGDAGVDSIAGLTSLRSLELSSQGFTDAVLPKLIHLKALEHLNLSGSSIKGPGLAHLVVLPRLSSLVLGSNTYDATELQHLPGLPSLRRLMFYKARLAEDVPAIIERLRRLESLELIETPLTTPRLAALKMALPTTEIQYEAQEKVYLKK